MMAIWPILRGPPGFAHRVAACAPVHKKRKLSIKAEGDQVRSHAAPLGGWLRKGGARASAVACRRRYGQ